MGTDIHFYVEILKDDKWIDFDYMKNSRDEDGKVDWKKLNDDPFYVDRCYNLFSILADVRNGYGFAGCSTGEKFVPISQPRGLPLDLSDETNKKSDDWECDGHGHSWLMLHELLDYDWLNQKRYHYGIVNKFEYIEFIKNGKPFSWSGGVFGELTKIVSNEEMDEVIRNNNTDFEYFTEIEWETSYADCAHSFYSKTIPALKELSKSENYDDVRIVFWFDD